MASVTLTFDMTAYHEAVEEIGTLYSKVGHRLSMYARRRIERMLRDKDVIRFEGLTVYPSATALCVLADLRAANATRSEP